MKLLQRGIYPQDWSEDFKDEFLLKGIRQWLQTGTILHDPRHVRDLDLTRLPTAESRLGIALARQLNLFSALQTLEAGLGEEALDYNQSSKGGGLEVGLTLLINEISALLKEMALVLDDFQVLVDPAALRGIGFLLKYLPPNLHLVIANRSQPDLDLAFLRAKGWVVELGADELLFTGNEVERYFQQASGLQFPSETVQTLEECPVDWITSLQMAAISPTRAPGVRRIWGICPWKCNPDRGNSVKFARKPAKN